MTKSEERDPRDPKVQTEDYIKENQIIELFEASRLCPLGLRSGGLGGGDRGFCL